VSERSNTDTATPLLRVITPGTTPEDIAAIITVLTTLGGTPQAPAPKHSEWANPARHLRTPHPHGPGAWRASSLPN
jgi:hypothetical protein